MNISVFDSAKDTVPSSNILVNEYLQRIKDGYWQDEVLHYRASRVEKYTLSAVSVSGSFNQRNKQGLKKHSGFICLDIDSKEQISAVNIHAINSDSYVYASHLSVSGNGGYAVLIRIDENRHEDAFLALQEYFMQNYNVVIDKSCKDITRLRFVSYDPDIYINEKAKIFKRYLKKKDKNEWTSRVIVVKTDFDEMVAKASHLNLFEDYSDYIKCAFALTSEFNESGRNYFHTLCRSSAKYNEKRADKDYSIALNRTGIIHIGWLYKRFKDSGIEIVSERTETIKRISNLSDTPVEHLKERGIEDVAELVEVFKTDGDKHRKPVTQLEYIIELIQLERIKFNEVTRNYEFNGIEMTDRILSEFYTKVWKKIDDSIAKDKVFTLIQNKENTKSYHPIKDWFLQNKNTHEDDFEFNELISCFEILQDELTEEEKNKFLRVFLKKWLMSLVGSAFGTYSLMILVLIGDQGTNKTLFFRNLLPQPLQKYYAESNLDEGKDSEILMTKKWLIVDDEFGGKSKKDDKKLKRLSSQQWFSIRMPYGKVSEDLLRLAVLGGTSNDSEVINDMTGNRRIIPINLISLDIERYKKIDKSKLFSWLYEQYEQDKEGWFLDKDEIEIINKKTVRNQEEAQEYELLLNCLSENAYNKMTGSDIMVALQNKYPTVRTNVKRIGMAMKKLGYDSKVVRHGKVFKRVYNVTFDNSINKNEETSEISDPLPF
jgi:hypothetical protein